MQTNAVARRVAAPRIIVAERQPLYRDALVALLAAGIADLSVVGTADLESLAADQEPGDGPALLIIGDDLVESTESLRRLAAASAGTAIVVHGTATDADHVARVMAAGARGFLPKTAAPQVIVAAIRLVLSGGAYLPEAVLGARHMREPRQDYGTAPAGSGLADLTPRQRAVLDLIARGYANKDIAEALAISLATVKVHVNAILKHLHVTNRTAAALAVLKRPADGNG